MEASKPPLTVKLFGPFEAWVNGRPLPRLRSRKGQWLLALLVLRVGAETERGWLATLLWPDSSDSQALANLRLCLKDLRRALGPEARRLVSPTARTLSLDLAGADMDVLAFDQAIARSDTASWERAIALYRGPLLQGCVEEWAFHERQVREQAYLQTLEWLADQALVVGDRDAAERCLRRVIAVEPFRETAQRALMRALAGGGNYAAALLVYRELRRRLHAEIHAEPDPETRELFQQLRAEAHLRSEAPSIAPASPAPAQHHPALYPPLLRDRVLTFLFTEIENSTRQWERDAEGMRAALDRHDAVLRDAIQAHGGRIFKTIGDQICAAFGLATDAAAAALAAQRSLQAAPWEPAQALSVRMALHTGEATARDGDYFGLPLSRVARLLAAGHGGQILVSRATQELVQDHLPEGVELHSLGRHRLKDLARPEQIFQLLAAGLPADFPPLDTIDLRLHNLPAQVTPLIGRENEVAAAQKLLRQEEIRLLTLTGPGGSGKTRLGLHVAAELLDQFAEGVFFVDLAPIREPELATATIAQTLGVREEADRPLAEALKAHLREKQILLLLDNFEQVLAAASVVSDLLASCPQLKIVVTSRAALNLRGEHGLPVPPLSLPDPAHLPPPEALSQYAAVDLFIQRAVAVKPEFAVTNANAPAVAEICHRLDGLPLAIELAAARIRFLTPENLLAGLENRLTLLTGGARDLPARQQTLRSAIGWSFDLLDEAERKLFRRLSVFVGGCTLKAAEAVCDPGDLMGIPVLNGIVSLLDKSLLRQEPDESGPRFTMLETIREFGGECLIADDETVLARQRHADYYLRWAEEAEGALSGADQASWMDRLARDHDNLRAALTWYEAAGAAEPGLRLATALARFWRVRGHGSEGLGRLARLLALPGAAERTMLRARALREASGLALQQNDDAAAWAFAEESLALSRELNDRRGMAASMGALGWIAHLRDEFEKATSLCQQSLAIWRELEDLEGLAGALNNLGGLAYRQGDFEVARQHVEEYLRLCQERNDRVGASRALGNLGLHLFQEGDDLGAEQFFTECLAISRELGHKPQAHLMYFRLGALAYRQGKLEDALSLFEKGLELARECENRPGVAYTLHQLGLLAYLAGDQETARVRCEESLKIARDAGEMKCIAGALHTLGEVACAQGDQSRARRYYQESLACFEQIPSTPGLRRFGPRFGIACCLEGLAKLTTIEANLERAASLFGAADGILRATGDQRALPERAEYGSHLAAAREALGEDRFAAAWAAGEALPLPRVVAVALEENEGA